MKRLLLMSVAGFVLAMVTQTQATLLGTPVNVNPGIGGNTVRNSDGSDGVTGGWLTSSFEVGKWDNRTNTVAAALQVGGDVLENETSTSVNTPLLKLTLTGLTPTASSYDI